jgi:hypothetical protein
MIGRPLYGRYRDEDGVSCIDLSVRTAPQLFDGRDPSPFRERDLDPAAADYLLGAVEDIPAERRLKVVVHVHEPLVGALDADAIESAVRAHFTSEGDRVSRELRQQRRFGRLTLVAGISALVVCLVLAELAARSLTGHLGEILQTGLMIMGWVVLWKPVELLLYDWWPLTQKRRDLARIAGAAIDVRAGPAAG